MSGTKTQLSLIRAALSTWGALKSKFLSVSCFVLLVPLCSADQLIGFDFSTDLAATQTAAHVTAATPLQAVLSAARLDGFTEAARANTWHLPQNTNYFRFSFAVEAGYVADIESVRFDSMSQKKVSTTNGPTQYNVSVGVGSAAFRSISGGWKTMAADGVWYRNVTASNGVGNLTNLAGSITIALAGKGANGDKSRWYVDNIAVNGRIRPLTRGPVPPRITSVTPRRALGLAGLAADQYYSVEYATDLASGWRWYSGAANLTSAGPNLSANIADLDGSPLFLRVATSFARLPSADLGGFWRVTSSNSPFAGSVIRFTQDGTGVGWEQSLLGKITDNSFTFGENGAEWMSGTVTGDTLAARCALPLAGMACTGAVQAVRWTGPMYDVWQGTNALTADQYYNPGSWGYTPVGQASTTATFDVTMPYLAVCANTLAPIDALGGPDSAYLAPATVSGIWTAGVDEPDALYGPPDAWSASVGVTNSGNLYRGYVAFGPVSWTSLTVTVGSPGTAPAAAPVPIPTNLLCQAFFLEYDSDGSAPLSDTVVALVFEPSGIAQLYAADTSDVLAYRGVYSYAGGQLSLTFTGADFHPNVRFAMDLTSPKVQMPFDVFQTGTAGPSRWRRAAPSTPGIMRIIYNCATVNEGLSETDAIARARSYAEALVRPPGLRALDDQGNPAAPILTSTAPLADGVRMNYAIVVDGVSYPIVLDAILNQFAAPRQGPLTPSAYYGNPHIILDPVKGMNGNDDPKEKNALLFFPLHDGFNNALSIELGTKDNTFLVQVRSRLEGRGYNVLPLLNENASVDKLVAALLSGQKSFVYFATHGNDAGALATGTYLGTYNTWPWTPTDQGWIPAFKNYLKYKKSVAASPTLKGLQDYSYGTQWALVMMDVPNYKGLDAIRVGITPAFWHWLRTTNGCSFSDSLVYFGACLTSRSSELRQAVRAKALFSYNVVAAYGTIGAVGRYLVESLARRTHTPEESYYNILLVAGSGQMRYQEDVYLNNCTTWLGTTGRGYALTTNLQGYATLGADEVDGPSGIMDYNNIGWLGKARADLTFHPGDVWWLLYRSRWSQDAQAGGSMLENCYQRLWKNLELGGLGDECQGCDPGTPPSQDEVAYSTYLLTGVAAETFSGTKVPRWTLNDGAPVLAGAQGAWDAGNDAALPATASDYISMTGDPSWAVPGGPAGLTAAPPRALPRLQGLAQPAHDY